MWQQEGEPDVSRVSFHTPLVPILVDPASGPQYCVSFNVAYRRIICGALLQLMERFVWDQSDPAAADEQSWLCYKLLTMFATSEICPVQEDGIQTITILPGDATAVANIVFGGIYTAIPKVDVSCDNGDLIASWHDVTLTDCILRVTAATPVAEDTVGVVSWSTNP